MRVEKFAVQNTIQIRKRTVPLQKRIRYDIVLVFIGRYTAATVTAFETYKIIIHMPKKHTSATMAHPSSDNYSHHMRNIMSLYFSDLFVRYKRCRVIIIFIIIVFYFFFFSMTAAERRRVNNNSKNRALDSVFLLARYFNIYTLIF